MNDDGSKDRLRPGGSAATMVRMLDFAELERRIARLTGEARGSGDAAVRERVEFTLSEGYARALGAEAQLRRLDERLEALIDELPAGEPRAIRDLAAERRRLARRVDRLRGRLAALSEGLVASLDG